MMHDEWKRTTFFKNGGHSDYICDSLTDPVSWTKNQVRYHCQCHFKCIWNCNGYYYHSFVGLFKMDQKQLRGTAEHAVFIQISLSCKRFVYLWWKVERIPSEDTVQLIASPEFISINFPDVRYFINYPGFDYSVSSCIHIGWLYSTTKKADLYELFQPYGVIKRITIRKTK